VAGKLPPETEKPVPEIESEFMVSAAVPFEVTVTDLVTAVPTETLPNAREVVLRLTPGREALSCMAKLFEEELALAVTVADAVEVTVLTVAVKEAVVAP
jgi:hypothetical protein